MFRISWNQSHFCDSIEKGGDEWYGDITVLSHSENCVVTLNVYEWKCNQIQSWHGGLRHSSFNYTFLWNHITVYLCSP